MWLLVMVRSAPGIMVVTSVAELLPGAGSMAPAGTATVAVFDSAPVAAGAMVQFALYVTLLPTGRFTVSLRLPLPAAVQMPPPAPLQVQVQINEAGNVSTTVARPARCSARRCSL